MKKAALRYGLYGMYIIIVLFIVEWLLFSDKQGNFEFREVLGWASIFLSVVFVYFGLKYYRDKQNGGSLTFAEGMKLGVLIVLIPSAAFGVLNVIYILLDPTFLDQYYNYQVAEIKNTVPAAELEQHLKKVKEEREMFANPLVQFIAMFLSVFVVGLILTIISTLMLKRKIAQPVAA